MLEDFFPVTLRVRYAETEQMGVVHHSVYAVWFEVGRTALSHAVGMPYLEWERRGVLLAVGELRCRFKKPARYDDEITVWTPELLTYPFDELSGRVIGWGDATGSRGDRGPRNARPRTGGEWTA